MLIDLRELRRSSGIILPFQVDNSRETAVESVTHQVNVRVWIRHPRLGKASRQVGIASAMDEDDWITAHCGPGSALLIRWETEWAGVQGVGVMECWNTQSSICLSLRCGLMFIPCSRRGRVSSG